MRAGQVVILGGPHLALDVPVVEHEAFIRVDLGGVRQQRPVPDREVLRARDAGGELRRRDVLGEFGEYLVHAGGDAALCHVPLFPPSYPGFSRWFSFVGQGIEEQVPGLVAEFLHRGEQVT